MYQRAEGQVLPLILFMLAVGGVLMVVMFNTTQKATDKGIATNAADAAAYSSGVWVARNLNYMAYTNRAMVANHVAVGHLITYVSWVRYIEDAAITIDRFARYIPWLAAASQAVKQSSARIRQLAEISAQGLVPSVSVINGLIYASQGGAVADLNAGKIDQLMKEVVKTYDPHLKVNSPGELVGSGAAFKDLVSTMMLAQRAALAGAVQVMDPGSDGGKMKQLVEMSYAGSERWLNNRSWEKQFSIIFKLRKKASTTHTMDAELTEWRAKDKLEFGRYVLTKRGWKWSWSTVGEGAADTSEFAGNYQGISGYTRMNGAGWLKSDDYPLYMDVVALTTKKDNLSTPNKRMNIDSTGVSISALGRARVFFKKPTEGFSGHQDEYANLFNPFWNTKLVEPLPGI